jgi:hypothetical protein
VHFPSTDFQTSLESEYLAFFYILFSCFGAFSIKINCNPTQDKKTFGKFIASDYTSNVTFIINDEGKYYLTIDHDFSHSTDEADRKMVFEIEREQRDMSFTNNRTEGGNINDWVSDVVQVKPPIKEPKKKIIKIHTDDDDNESA